MQTLGNILYVRLVFRHTFYGGANRAASEKTLVQSEIRKFLLFDNKCYLYFCTGWLFLSYHRTQLYNHRTLAHANHERTVSSASRKNRMGKPKGGFSRVTVRSTIHTNFRILHVHSPSPFSPGCNPCFHLLRESVPTDGIIEAFSSGTKRLNKRAKWSRDWEYVCGGLEGCFIRGSGGYIFTRRRMPIRLVGRLGGRI